MCRWSVAPPSECCYPFDEHIERRNLYRIVRICLALHFGWTAHLGFGYLLMIPNRHSLLSFSHDIRVLAVFMSMRGPESAY